MLTREQAQVLIDAHFIDEVMDNEEEVEILRDQNPELLEAYETLMEIATGVGYRKC